MENGLGGWVYGNDYGNDFMKDIKYKNKTIKMDERTWKTLKEKRIKSGLSWNQFLLSLISKK